MNGEKVEFPFPNYSWLNSEDDIRDFQDCQTEFWDFYNSLLFVHEGNIYHPGPTNVIPSDNFTGHIKSTE